jgi:hypothetical protein
MAREGRVWRRGVRRMAPRPRDAVLAGPDSAEGGDGGGRVRGEPKSRELTNGCGGPD